MCSFKLLLEAAFIENGSDKPSVTLPVMVTKQTKASEFNGAFNYFHQELNEMKQSKEYNTFFQVSKSGNQVNANTAMYELSKQETITFIINR